jgi:hypothetical protein
MNMKPVQQKRVVSVVLVGTALVVGRSVLAVADDDWYVISIAGSPVGSLHTVLKRENGEQVETQEMRVVLNRLGSRVEMASTVASREDSAGRLVSVSMELDASDQSTTMNALVEPGWVRIEQTAGEASFQRALQYRGQLLGPAGIRERIRESLKQVGDKAQYKTFPADLGVVLELELELMAVEDGLHRVEVRPSGASAGLSQWMDAHGKLVRSVLPSPFGEMETVLSDAATAKLATAGNELPEESYAATLARTQIRLPEPRRSSRVLLEIRHRNPVLGWPDLTASRQTVLEQTEDRLLLEVRRTGSVDPAQFPVEPSEATRQYLEANAYIQSDDPRIRKLAQTIVGDTTEIFCAMQVLERWTAENMTFDFGVVLAPSSEVVENRKGTCTEYAVLLTTLARSLGIPARFVMGYVYVGGIYGGHAWCEVLIGDQWVGFDGAVPADGPVDAARIAFQWASLADGVGALFLGPGMQMYGQIDLAVLEYDLDNGDTRRYSTDDDTISIDDHQYRNGALNVTWSVPASYAFKDLDRVWPETGLVSVEGPGGVEATLRVRDRRSYWLDEEETLNDALRLALPGGRIRAMEVAGRERCYVESADQAVLALVRGSELWLLEVAAPEPGNRLRELAHGLKL